MYSPNEKYWHRKSSCLELASVTRSNDKVELFFRYVEAEFPSVLMIGDSTTMFALIHLKDLQILTLQNPTLKWDNMILTGLIVSNASRVLTLASFGEVPF